ncbi:MAG: PH domain-containing protein [Candidatus Aenigmarchaeota archaeon]|nr:PH domain-containing protein [Candidatus Aenigmarchaeota archaeon]
MLENYELKPNIISFVRYSYVKALIISSLFFGALYYAVNIFAHAYALYVIAAFVLVQAFDYYSLSVKYRKEKYIFLDNKIIHKSGGIFSDSQTELLIKNITHVGMRLNYIEHRILFETGNIRIESAGSGGTEVHLRSINNTEKIYEYIGELMKHNGFKLAKENILQQERPSTIGVFLETFKNFVSTSLLIAYIGGTTYSALPVMEFVGLNRLTVLSVAGLVISAIFANTFLRFMDLKKRVYNVYSDTITYAEGFLTKNEAFIPIENLADTTITQNIIDKIFNLYDVKISCQGSGQEILFKNMKNGKELEENIDRLIGESRSSERTVPIEHSANDLQAPRHTASRATIPQGDTSFTAEYGMDGRRTLLPLLAALPIFLILLIAVPGFLMLGILTPFIVIWIVVFVVTLIKMNATKYLVKPKSMEEQYNFISSKNKEFSNEKITGIIFKESFIDKWFNTCSIHFWSIGSSEKVIFSNIYKTDELRKSIAAKSGMWSREVLYNINSDFSVIDMIKANLLANVLGGLFMASIIAASILYSPWLAVIPAVAILLYAVIICYNKIYYMRSKMTFFKNHIYFEKGVFFKNFYYILYDNIKNISTVKYPFSESGSVTFDVAGEQVEQSGKNQVVLSNSFAISYAPGIENKDDLIDMIFYKRPDAEEIKNMEENISQYNSKPVLTAKPDIMNSLVPLVIGSIIIFPFIALLPLTIPLTIWSVKVTSYIIEPYRVLKKSGILYKKQKSIVFSKIDHINFEEGFLNKMFQNGTVTINTVGSSKPEMKVANTSNFRAFYDKLKKYY